MPNATGTFTITSMNEDPYHEQDGSKLTRAGGTQTFAGGIQGEGAVEWLMCYTPDGTARFLGLQRIAGTLDGRSGSFVIEATGDHDGSRSKGGWRVIAGSGTGDLAGLTGEGWFEAPGGPEATYSLDYDVS